MKKLIALVLTLTMVASMGIMAFAEKGGFVYSPSANPTPTIEDYDCDEDCSGELIITPFSERDTLDPDEQEKLQDAYDDIINIEESDLVKIIEELSDSNDIPEDMLLVSDLFNINVDGCEEHDGHVPYEVQLSSDAFKNFVSIVHYDNGEWVKIDNVEKLEGDTIRFTYDGYGPFAVIVNKNGSPITGDNGVLIFCVVIMAVSAVGFVTALVASKKKKAVQSK